MQDINNFIDEALKNSIKINQSINYINKNIDLVKIEDLNEIHRKLSEELLPEILRLEENIKWISYD